MSEKPEPTLDETLARQQFEIDRLKDAFGLLGITACSWCNKFYRRTDPGALFDTTSGLVCYADIAQWWQQRCAQLSTKDRGNLEGKLVFWLRDFHHAESFKDPAKLPDPSLQELNIVATCLECRGTGKMLGEERCRYCDGRGTIWVIVSNKKD